MQYTVQITYLGASLPSYRCSHNAHSCTHKSLSIALQRAACAAQMPRPAKRPRPQDAREQQRDAAASVLERSAYNYGSGRAAKVEACARAVRAALLEAPPRPAGAPTGRGGASSRTERTLRAHASTFAARPLP